jgi:hypothetical protein
MKKKENITLAEVKKALQDIAMVADVDPESGYAQMDAVYKAVLTTIANGAVNPKLLAKTALKAEEIKFKW